MSVAAGEQLRAAREVRGWSVEDVATRLKLPVRYVGALERGDVAMLPEPTFVRGYVKAYAKLVALDGDALVAMQAPVEVKAPRQLVGPDGTVAASSRRSQAPRAPSFRSGSRRHHWVLGGMVLLVAIGGGTWLAREDAAVTVAPAVLVAPSAAPLAVPAAAASAPVVAVGGGISVEVPLPGAQPAPAVAALPPPVVPAVGATGTTTTPAAASSATAPVAKTVAAALPTPQAMAPVTQTAPVPRKGLFVRFNSTCWVEVRDADNVVLHTRIEMAGSEIQLEGKAPLTVTLGDAAGAQVWYNGDRVVADRFASTGITRIIAGQAGR